MRINFYKKNFTKSERIIGRLLQENHIPFKTKVKISGREVDFLIGRVAVEIDGHEQAEDKNNMLVISGYIPLHFSNDEVYTDRLSIIKTIKNHLCLQD